MRRPTSTQEPRRGRVPLARHGELTASSTTRHRPQRSLRQPDRQLGTWTVQVFAPNTNAGNRELLDRDLRRRLPGLRGSASKSRSPATRLARAALRLQRQRGRHGQRNRDWRRPALGLTTGESAAAAGFEVVDPGPDGLLGHRRRRRHRHREQHTFTDADGAGAGFRFDSAKILLSRRHGARSRQRRPRRPFRPNGPGRLPGRGSERCPADQPQAHRAHAPVDCRPSIAAGGVVFAQFGKDAFTLVSGGCEKDARGYFTFGFPDRYMDDGELVSYLVAFQSAEIGARPRERHGQPEGGRGRRGQPRRLQAGSRWDAAPIRTGPTTRPSP